MTHLKTCEEFGLWFGKDLIPHEGGIYSNKLFKQIIDKIKFCPFCGQEL